MADKLKASTDQATGGLSSGDRAPLKTEPTDQEQPLNSTILPDPNHISTLNSNEIKVDPNQITLDSLGHSKGAASLTLSNTNARLSQSHEQGIAGEETRQSLQVNVKKKAKPER